MNLKVLATSRLAKPGFVLILLLVASTLVACGETTPKVSTNTPDGATLLPITNTSVNTVNNDPNATVAKIKVVATTTQLGDFLRNIGGERVEVYQILRPNDDPHDYSPTANDSKAAAAAQVVFKIGVGLDDWLD